MGPRNKKTRLVYEKPVLVSFSMANALGAACQPGSTATGSKCQPGTTADQKCQDGNIAARQCNNGGTPA